jgi:hypothetical protein
MFIILTEIIKFVYNSKHKLLILLILVSCGKVKIQDSKHTIEAKPMEVKPIPPIEVLHKIGLDLSVFQEQCREEYKDIEDEQIKQDLINQCIKDYTEEFIILLDNLQNSQDNGNNSQN